MSNVLGQVLQDIPEQRGPDVAHRVTIARDWLSSGARFSVELPRRLVCARCDGGGCDACERRGALVLRETETEPERVEVSLGALPPGPVRLRIPDYGAPGAPDEPRGVLELTVVPGEQSDESAELLVEAQPAVSFVPWLALAAVLVLAIWLLAR